MMLTSTALPGRLPDCTPGVVLGPLVLPKSQAASKPVIMTSIRAINCFLRYCINLFSFYKLAFGMNPQPRENRNGLRPFPTRNHFYLCKLAIARHPLD